MKLTPIQLYLNSLRAGNVRAGYVTREVAYAKLKHLTGQDFGYDVEKWRAWCREHSDSYGQIIREKRTPNVNLQGDEC